MASFLNSGNIFDKIGQLFSDPKAAWDEFSTGGANALQADIANQNLNYQRERNAIEDARYEDERDYARAFAEDERDYNRALQQQIFDREDTAFIRQAEQLSALGINPLSQSMSGSPAGEVVGGATPAAMSARGGFALHNDFQMQNNGLLNAISPIMSLANGVSQLNTDGIQRDALREQNDYQRLLNQEKALENKFLENKLKAEEEGREEENRHKKSINPSEELNAKASAERNERENVFQNDFGVTDNTNNYVRLATDIANQTGRAADYVSDKVDNVSSSAMGVLSQAAIDKIQDYKDYLKNGWENDKSRFKKFFKKINDFGEKYLSANY